MGKASVVLGCAIAVPAMSVYEPAYDMKHRIANRKMSYGLGDIVIANTLLSGASACLTLSSFGSGPLIVYGCLMAELARDSSLSVSNAKMVAKAAVYTVAYYYLFTSCIWLSLLAMPVTFSLGMFYDICNDYEPWNRYSKQIDKAMESVGLVE